MKAQLITDLVRFSNTKLISDKRRLFEIFAVVLTALGKFIFMDYLNWRLPYVTFAIISWLVYIIYSYKQDANILAYWGFRTDTFKPALKLMLSFGIVSIVVFMLVGYYQGTLNVTWHILPLLITYPIWGTIQQFLTIGLIAGNLNDLKRIRLNKNVIILLTAVLFSVVHYPSIWLMTGTFVLALFYGYIYLKVKNLYLMGLFHGWLGALFYYTVVNKDPFEELFLNTFKSLF